MPNRRVLSSIVRAFKPRKTTLNRIIQFGQEHGLCAGLQPRHPIRSARVGSKSTKPILVEQLVPIKMEANFRKNITERSEKFDFFLRIPCPIAVSAHGFRSTDESFNLRMLGHVIHLSLNWPESPCRGGDLYEVMGSWGIYTMTE